MSEHVPTDWQLGSLTPGLLICRRDGLQIKIDAIDDDLACFILHAVKDYQKTAAMRNSHNGLIEALRAARRVIRCDPLLVGTLGVIDDALAAAEGK